jgi:hypothetical protein
MLDAAAMSEILVTPEELAAVSARLGSIGAGVEQVCGYVRGCAGAAAGTPAEGAVDAMLGRFSSVLPHYGLAGEHLSGAVAGAGVGYTRSEDEVAGACEGGGGPE